MRADPRLKERVQQGLVWVLVCVGWRTVALLRNRAALWLLIAPAICLQLCWCSSPSLSCRHPLSRAKHFPHPHQHNAMSFSLACNIPWLFLLPHLCSLICLQRVGADLSSPQLSGTVTISGVSEVRHECGHPAKGVCCHVPGYTATSLRGTVNRHCRFL